jgi:Domain of unknown function (DUF4291)
MEKNIKEIKMKLITRPYKLYEKDLPQKGQYILGQTRGENIIVYQAYNHFIADFALKNQRFGGPYSFNRMSWIKPNFLWMMYRAGWATKENQERILAIEIGLDKFEMILEQAVHSSFQEHIYKTHDNWTAALNQSEVRLQWDPDHNPLGHKLERRAIQLGMKGEILKHFATDWIVSIEDITDFVKEQNQKINVHDLDNLSVIQEQVVKIKNEEIAQKLQLGD